MIYTENIRFQFRAGAEEKSQNPEEVFEKELWKEGMSISCIPLTDEVPVDRDGRIRSSKIVSFEKILDDGSIYELKDEKGRTYRLIH